MSPPNHEADRQVLLALIAAAGKLERRLDGALSAIRGVSFREYQLLHALLRMPDASGTRVRLAQEVGLTPSGVTRALRPLEKIGVVRTKKDARDARRSLAVLTPAGKRLLADATTVVHDVMADTLERLPAGDGLRAADRDRTFRFLHALARS